MTGVTGENSPYAAALLKNLEAPNVDVRILFGKIRDDVKARTDKRQIPHTYGSLPGKSIYLNALKTKQSITSSAKTAEKTNNNAAEIVYWDSIKDASSAAYFQSYIIQYPQGLFVPIAKLNIARINGVGIVVKKLLSSENLDDEELSLAKVQKENGDSVISNDENSSETIRNIQNELNRLGCSAGKADGNWGKKSRKALELFGRHKKLNLATLEPSPQLLSKLKAQSVRICPKACPHGYEFRDERCERTLTTTNTFTNFFVNAAPDSKWVGKASYNSGITFKIKINKSGNLITADYPGHNCSSKYIVKKHLAKKSVFEEVSNPGTDASCNTDGFGYPDH